MYCQGSQMELKGFQFSEKPNHSSGITGAYRWVEVFVQIKEIFHRDPFTQHLNPKSKIRKTI